MVGCTVWRVATYTVLDHTADTGIEATAPDLKGLIETLATGMFALMADVRPCPSGNTISLGVTERGNEDLVYEVLSELLYQSEVHNILFCDFVVEAGDGGGLEITARGVPSDEVELTGPPIKAVTYHDIEVIESEGSWHGRVYFDV